MKSKTFWETYLGFWDFYGNIILPCNGVMFRKQHEMSLISIGIDQMIIDPFWYTYAILFIVG